MKILTVLPPLQFAILLSTFRPIRKATVTEFNNREGKIRFLFRLYDVDKDNRLSKDDFHEVFDAITKSLICHVMPIYGVPNAQIWW